MYLWSGEEEEEGTCTLLSAAADEPGTPLLGNIVCCLLAVILGSIRLPGGGPWVFRAFS